MKIDTTRLREETYRQEVLEQLMHAHAAEITRYCVTWLGASLGLAEDVTQEVFLTAWEKLPQFRPEGALGAWLRGIARHKCQQAFRNASRRRDIAWAFSEDIRQQTHAASPLVPEQQMLEVTEQTLFETCLRALPEDYRIVLVLYYQKHVAVADIADVLGRKADAIRKLLGRARRHLREAIRHASHS